MKTGIPVSKKAVRRFLLKVNGLASAPTRLRRAAGVFDALDVIRQIQCVQLDSVASVERNHHLVLAARVGPGFKPHWHNDMLAQGQLFEYMANAACILPIEDYPLYECIRRHYRQSRAEQLETYRPVAESVLARIKEEGPLASSDFVSAERVNGYWDNKEPKTKVTSHVLNLLHDSGQIRVVGRQGILRTFDLTERTVPAELLEQARALSDEEAESRMLHQYMRAYRVFDIGDPRFGWAPSVARKKKQLIEQSIEAGLVVPLRIEGVDKPYYILAEDLDELMECGQDSGQVSDKVVFLPPLDNLLWRRPRLLDLFDFDYKWEIYTPAAKRIYGSYTMPILQGDRLIGRIDPRLDRKRGVLQILMLQLEPGIRVTKSLKKQMHKAVKAFSLFHGAHSVEGPASDPQWNDIWL